MSTYTLIASANLSSGSAANITFSSIPQSFTDLVVWLSVRNNGGNYGGYWAGINNANSTGSRLQMRNDTASTRADMIDSLYWPLVGDSPLDNYAQGYIYIPNYKNSTRTKVYWAQGMRHQGNPGVFARTIAISGQTGAITSLVIGTDIDAIAQHSTAYLYGISNA